MFNGLGLFNTYPPNHTQKRNTRQHSAKNPIVTNYKHSVFIFLEG